MIHWTLSLTGNQIAVLKALKGREFGKPWDRDNNPAITHWITGVRGLLKENLIYHVQTMYKDRPNIADGSRSGQFLTERGKFILEMIEQDLAKFLDQTQPKKRHKPQKENAA